MGLLHYFEIGVFARAHDKPGSIGFAVYYQGLVLFHGEKMLFEGAGVRKSRHNPLLLLELMAQNT